MAKVGQNEATKMQLTSAEPKFTLQEADGSLTLGQFSAANYWLLLPWNHSILATRTTF
jgi:hypothetical protein